MLLVGAGLCIALVAMLSGSAHAGVPLEARKLPMKFSWVDCQPNCRGWVSAAGIVTADSRREFDEFARGRHLALGDGLARGDEAFAAVTAMVDEHVLKTGLDAPPADAVRAARAGGGPPIDTPRELDVASAGITSVVWATGYRTDFGWIRLRVFDGRGAPMHRRGVTASPGLYFLGLPWLWKLKSSVLCGVGEDAEHIAEDIEAARRRPTVFG